jgi:hypothetical protein
LSWLSRIPQHLCFEGNLLLPDRSDHPRPARSGPEIVPLFSGFEMAL